MITINPRKGDLFYMRLLMKYRTEATSFADLKFHNNQEIETYKAVSIARGLLEDNIHWYTTLLDAIAIVRPPSIRLLFCNIILYGY